MQIKMKGRTCAWVLLVAGYSAAAQGGAVDGGNKAGGCRIGDEAELASKAHALTANLSLSAKIGQMIQADYLDLAKALAAGQHPVRDLGLGSILSGGDSIIPDNTPAGWRAYLGAMQQEAAASASGLPLLTGVDAMHGHGILHGATVFPHNIGLGATRDPELLEAVAAATAAEVLATGFNWAFAPTVTVVQDVRWGRSYESYGERAELQQLLTPAFVRGLSRGPLRLIGSAKHFIGDGGTKWGTGYPSSTTQEPQIDRGDNVSAIKDLIALHGQGYAVAVDAGIDTVMASYNSVNGVHMHANGALINGYLKAAKADGGLGFHGMVVSDWNAIDDIPTPGITEPVARYKSQVLQAVQAGVDMIMVAERLKVGTGVDAYYRYERVHQMLMEAVLNQEIGVGRIDDAVERILRTKVRAGLFCGGGGSVGVGNGGMGDGGVGEGIGSEEQRGVARRAVGESLVLLKNTDHTLPVVGYRTLCVAGGKADDYGAQSGGWTVGWQGRLGNSEKVAGANTVLDGLKAEAKQRDMRVVYAPSGAFTDPDCRQAQTSLTVVVVGEAPYAEYKGDSNDLHLAAEDEAVFNAARRNAGRLVGVVLAGRPLIITDQLPLMQALVMAWLPGSQGEGVADVLFGRRDFVGRLPVTWPGEMGQVDRKRAGKGKGEGEGLFGYGFGMKYWE